MADEDTPADTATSILDKDDIKAIALEVFAMIKASAEENPAKTRSDGVDPPPPDRGRLNGKMLLAPPPLGTCSLYLG